MLSSSPKPQLNRIFRLVKSDRLLLFGGLSAMIVGSSATLAIPLGLGHLVDLSLSNSGATEYSGPLVLGIGGLTFTSATATLLRSLCFSLASARLVKRLRVSIFDRLLRQPAEFFDRRQTGELLSRLGTDVEVLCRSLSGPVLSQGLRAFIQGTGCIVVMSNLSPQLMGVTCTVVPLIAIMSWLYGRFIRTLQTRIQKAVSQANQTAEETFTNLKTVKAFANENLELDTFRRRTNDIFDKMKTSAYYGAAYFGSTQLVGNGSLLAILVYGTNLTSSGAVSLGQLTSFVLYTMYLGMSVVSLSSAYSEINKGLGASTAILNLLELKPPPSPKIPPGLSCLTGGIVFKNVTFCYPTRPSYTVFDNLNLSINEGQVLGICGGSGCGKSTLTHLLLQFYRSYSGIITIGGVDVGSVNRQWLRKQISIVSQEPVLFSGTVVDNIRYARPTATIDEVVLAAREANADAFITSLPGGYNADIGERGKTLSGGQKQRIAIARAILKDSRILVLDEATSSLDSESETLVQDALQTLMKGRTTIVIAHRLSTLRQADQIAVMESGRIVEKGNYEELMKRPGGSFYSLMAYQNV